MSTLQTLEDKNVQMDVPIPSKEPIYVMTIELDQGNAERIEIYSDSNPEEISYDFCRKNNLDYQSLNYLKQQIEELIAQNNPKSLQKIPSIPRPNQSYGKLSKPKEKDVGVQVTPLKSLLFSCESFFVTLQERNQAKSSKSNQNKKIIQLTKYGQRGESQKQKIDLNKLSTPLKTESNKPSSMIPHPQVNKCMTKFDSNPSLKLNHLDFDGYSNKSSNYFKDSSSRSNSKHKKNIGVILYEKGNKLKAKKDKKIEEIRNNLDKKAGIELTFKPLVYTSPILNKNTSQRKESLNESQKDQLSLNVYSNGHTSPESAKIKPISSNFRPPSSKSQKKLRINTSKMNEEFSYHPHLTDYHLTDQTKLSFSSRQKLFKQKYEDNNTKLTKDLSKNIDGKTGQPYFRPSLISKQQKKSKSPSNNIFDDLYSCASLYKVNQIKRKDIIDKEIKKMIRPKISDNSEEIFQKKKENVFKKIFNIFDSDEDGLISIYSIDPSKLPSNIYSIIKPIIMDLKEYQGEINCDDFIIEGNKLFEVS